MKYHKLGSKMNKELSLQIQNNEISMQKFKIISN